MCKLISGFHSWKILKTSNGYLRKNWLPGAVFPLVTLAVFGLIFAVLYETLIMVLPNYLIGRGILILLEIFIWADGRRQYRKNEMNKIKAQDIE